MTAIDIEMAARAGSFFGVLALLIGAEFLWPRRQRPVTRSSRWVHNLAILALNPVAVRLLFPVVPVGAAALAAQNHWGLLNQVALPFWLSVAVSVILLDLVIYLQHLMLHAVPTLWRLHMVHHSDLDIDVTTALRLHPLEIVFSLGIKLAAVVLIGAPVLGVLLFEIILNATSMFIHSNLYLPPGADRLLRLLLVTPDMHRLHHSVIIRETNSNFGFSLTWWDYLFGTYRSQPAKGHQEMTIGLAQFRDAKRLTFPWLLALPFVYGPGPQPINRH